MENFSRHVWFRQSRCKYRHDNLFVQLYNEASFLFTDTFSLIWRLPITSGVSRVCAWLIWATWKVLEASLSYWAPRSSKKPGWGVVKGVVFFPFEPLKHGFLLFLYLEPPSEPTTVQFAQRGARGQSDGYCTVASNENHGLGNPQIKSNVRCSSKQYSEVGPMNHERSQHYMPGIRALQPPRQSNQKKDLKASRAYQWFFLSTLNPWGVQLWTNGWRAMPQLSFLAPFWLPHKTKEMRKRPGKSWKSWWMPSRCRLTLAKSSDKQPRSTKCIIWMTKIPSSIQFILLVLLLILGNTVGGWSKGNTVAMAERFWTPLARSFVSMGYAWSLNSVDICHDTYDECLSASDNKTCQPLLQTGILKGILKPGNASPGWYFFVGRYLLFPVVQPQNRGVLQVEEHRNLRLKLEAYVLKEFCSTLLTIGSCCLIVGDPIHHYLYIILGFYPTWAVGHKHLLASNHH